MSGAVASNAGAVEILDPPVLPPTVHPRPAGEGWRLLEYSWANGLAELRYRQNGSGAKCTVHQLQPAHEDHAGWDQISAAARRAKVAAAAEGARFRGERAGRRGWRGPR